MLVAIALGLAAAASAQQVSVRVTVGVSEVELGAPFDLEVERVWDTSLEPEPWSDASLAPLRLSPVDDRRRTVDGRVEELRSFRARAFVLGGVTIPALAFHATPIAGGEPRIATTTPIAIHVRRRSAPPTRASRSCRA